MAQLRITARVIPSRKRRQFLLTKAKYALATMTVQGQRHLEAMQRVAAEIRELETSLEQDEDMGQVSLMHGQKAVIVSAVEGYVPPVVLTKNGGQLTGSVGQALNPLVQFATDCYNRQHRFANIVAGELVRLEAELKEHFGKLVKTPTGYGYTCEADEQKDVELRGRLMSMRSACCLPTQAEGSAIALRSEQAMYAGRYESLCKTPETQARASA